MTAGTARVPAFIIAGLLAALLCGYAIGRATGGGATQAASAPNAIPSHQHGAPAPPAGGDATSGLSVSAAGYTLLPTTTTIQPGAAATFAFSIIGPDRKPVTRFATVHDAQLHLIIVRRDLSGYQHLHPTLDAAGTWTVPLRLPEPGVYRAYADFATSGANGTLAQIVLGVDLTAPGPYAPAPLPAAAQTATAGPLTVTMDGKLPAGAIGTLYFRFSSGGAPATDQVQRYLGSYAHLVAVREGDLALVHTHGDDLTDLGIRCFLPVPGPGRYRLFLDVKVADAVYTAAYTQLVA